MVNHAPDRDDSAAIGHGPLSRMLPNLRKSTEAPIPRLMELYREDPIEAAFVNGQCFDHLRRPNGDKRKKQLICVARCILVIADIADEIKEIHVYGYQALASKLEQKLTPNEMRKTILELRNADYAIGDSTDWFQYVFQQQILPSTQLHAPHFYAVLSDIAV